MTEWKDLHYIERFLLLYGSIFALLSLLILILMVGSGEISEPEEKQIIPYSLFADIEIKDNRNYLNISMYDKNYLVDKNYTRQYNNLYDVFEVNDSKYLRDFHFRYCRLNSSIGLYFTRFSDEEPAFKYMKNNKWVTYTFPDCNRVKANLLFNGIEYPNVYDGITYRFKIIGSSILFDAIITDSSINSYTIKIDTNDKIKIKDNKIKIGKIKIKEPLVHNKTLDLIDIPNYELIENGDNTYLKVNFLNYDENEYPIYCDPSITDYDVMEDTWLRKDSPTTVYGTATQWYVVDQSDERVSLLRYNLTELTNLSLTSDLITSATLYLYQTSTGYLDNQRIGVFQLSDNTWTEGTATWNNYDFASNIIEPAITYDIVESRVSWESFDILEEIQDGLDETRPLNLGFGHATVTGYYYDGTGSSIYWRFWQSDYSSNTPYIVIEYDIPTWTISDYQFINGQSLVKYNIEITDTGQLYLNDSLLRIVDTLEGITFYVNGTLNVTQTTIKTYDDNGINVFVDSDAKVNFTGSYFRCLGDTYFPIWDLQNTNCILDATTFYQNGCVKLSALFRVRVTQYSQSDIITTNRGLIINTSISILQILTVDRITITNNAWCYAGNLTDNNTVYVNSSGMELIKGHLETIRVMDISNSTLLNDVLISVENKDNYPLTRSYVTGIDSWHGTGRHRRVALYNFSYFKAEEIEISYFNLSKTGYQNVFYPLPSDTSKEFIDFYMNLTPIALDIKYYHVYDYYQFNGSGLGYLLNQFAFISSVDGEFYNSTSNHTYSYTLTEGNHIIYFQCKDNNGVWSNQSQLNITILKYSPIVTGYTIENVYDRYWFNFTGEGYSYNITKYRIWRAPATIIFEKGYSSYTTLDEPEGIRSYFFQVMNENNEWSVSVWGNNILIVKYSPNATYLNVTNIYENYTFTGDGLGYSYNITDYAFNSSIDGEFYNSTSNHTTVNNLTEGNHTIYLYVKNDNGEWSTNNLSINVTISRYNPIAYIVNISIEIEIYVIFNGNGTVYNGTIELYYWASSINGIFYNNTSNPINATGFSAGNHTIYFKIMDSNGKWSEMVNTTVLIQYTTETVLWYNDKEQVKEIVVIVFVLALITLMVLHLLKKY